MVLRTLFLFSLITCLAACGFQPRGKTALPDSGLSPVHVFGLASHHNFYRILVEELENAGVQLGNKDNANSAIRILQQKAERFVLTVDSRGKTVEYELEESVTYRVIRAGGELKSEPYKLTTRRILLNPGTKLLGRDREEAMLRKDMYRELALRMIQQFAAIR